MFCQKCGQSLPADAQFCVNCGQTQATQWTAQPTAAQQYSPGAQYTSGAQTLTKSKKPYILIGAAAVVVVIVIIVVALSSGGGGSRPSSLVGTWDWEFMPGAVVLRADGGYSWLGVNYGAMGFRWSARNGVVSYSRGGISTPWFNYQFIDDDTIRIEYVTAPGVSYTLRRRA